MTVKLTKAQRAMLQLAAEDRLGERDGRAWRATRALRKFGFLEWAKSGPLRQVITPEGRAALTQERGE